MLQVEHVRRSFGGLQVLRDCSVHVRRGEIVGLIGPNGAGKTTLFNVIAGTLLPDHGEIRLMGEPITGRPAHEIARRGLVRTFQIPRLFLNMPVIENLMVAAPEQVGESLWSLWWRLGAIRKQEAEVERRAWRILHFLRMEHMANEPALALSGGQKKLLELGRALMLDPQVLLLDEPVAGVNPTLAAQIGEHIRSLRDQGKTFLIVEHNMEFVMELSDRLYVLAEGSVLAEGDPEAIRSNQRVLDAYLGVI